MKRLGGIALIGALMLTGCSAPDRASQARDLCVNAAEAEVGASVNGELEAMNMGDALFDADITDKRDTDDADATFTVVGDVTWEDGGTENRRAMLCTVVFEDGTAGEPELALS